MKLEKYLTEKTKIMSLDSLFRRIQPESFNVRNQTGPNYGPIKSGYIYEFSNYDETFWIEVKGQTLVVHRKIPKKQIKNIKDIDRIERYNIVGIKGMFYARAEINITKAMGALKEMVK